MRPAITNDAICILRPPFRVESDHVFSVAESRVSTKGSLAPGPDIHGSPTARSRRLPTGVPRRRTDWKMSCGTSRSVHRGGLAYLALHRSRGGKQFRLPSL